MARDMKGMPSTPEGRRLNRKHLMTLFVPWAILTIIMEPLIWFVLQPHIPPGGMTDSANGLRFDATVVTMTGGPVVLGVLEYFAYALMVWRVPRGAPLEDGPPIRSNIGVQAAWIAITSTIVMAMFVFGTYELVVPAGSGGGEGPTPIWTPASHKILPIQVIGQQWRWTYRYPTFGGFETDALVIPNNTEIAFHVTSLDVIHDFWAYQLGVKADANPQVDNVAFTKTQQTGRFVVRCDELCGVWHGAMYNYGQVVTPSQFMSWATSNETKLAAMTKTLPPVNYAGYTPSANGAAGGYYPTLDPFSSVEETPTPNGKAIEDVGAGARTNPSHRAGSGSSTIKTPTGTFKKPTTPPVSNTKAG